MNHVNLSKYIKAQAQTLRDLNQILVRNFNIDHFPEWVLEAHECPVCHNYVKQYEDIESINAYGMCLGCEQILAEGWEEFDNA